MPRQLDYYNRSAARFVEGTLRVDMAALHARFLAHLPAGALLLVPAAARGDRKAFPDPRFRVWAFGTSAKAQLAPRPKNRSRYVTALSNCFFLHLYPI